MPLNNTANALSDKSFDTKVICRNIIGNSKNARYIPLHSAVLRRYVLRVSL
jgi:hypothetical protein